jgi:hypothetical protein
MSSRLVLRDFSPVFDEIRQFARLKPLLNSWKPSEDG